MKLRLKIRNPASGNEWLEEYDKRGIGDNGNVQQAQDWAFELVKHYNATLRPGESPRELLSTEIVGTSTEHDWYKRTDGMSVSFRGRMVDLFECSKCGVTGKKGSLAGSIKRDSKFKGKKYAICGGEPL